MSADWVVVHAGALGDLVLTVQRARRLPRADPNDRLHLISRSDPGNLTSCQPSITHQAADGLELHWLYAETDTPPPAPLRDAIGGARVLSALGGAESVVHRRLASLDPDVLYSFDPRPRPGLKRHITQQWQTDLEAQGLLIPERADQHPVQHGLRVPQSLRDRGRDVLREIGSDAGAALIHPGSGGREKCWPLPGFVDVARRMRARGVPACFLVGPVELEWWPSENLDALEREFPVLRMPDPDALAAALAAARVAVANDSGPAHLAALLGTRTVVLFGPTSATLWQPLGPDVQVIAGDPQAHGPGWDIYAVHVATLAVNATRGT